MSDARIAVVGAGPAGLRAAETLVAQGQDVTLIDEADFAGGQIYRQPPAALARPAATLYGAQAEQAQAIHALGRELAGKLDYRRATSVWHARPGRLDLLHAGQVDSLDYSRIVLATGATDRPMPFDGWTRPGVFTLGGAQVALKYQGCVVGERVVFTGTGPLLYLVAYQYAKAGAKVVAVHDSAPFAEQARHAWAMTALPGMLARGLYYVGWLRAHGIPVRYGMTPRRVIGDARVEGLVSAGIDGRQREDACDAIATGFGLRSENQIADLLGCDFAFDPINSTWNPAKDPAGRSSVAEVYLAGDGAGIGGADQAELDGERVAWALLQHSGVAAPPRRIAELDAALVRSRRFRQAIDQAFALPALARFDLHDEVMLCRCEAIRVGEVRQAVRDAGITDLNRLKALTRVGMGRCQGRMCSTGAACVLAETACVSLAQVGRVRAQPPIKPVPLSAYVDADPASSGVQA
jgi:NADPH-dependent 2,4-dienoyl-CoA reductase/sulfur reductase-like enzyme